MTKVRNKIDCIRSVFPISIIILSAMIFVNHNIDMAYSQSKSLVTSYDVKEFTHSANSSLSGSQIIENGTLSKDYHITNTSAISDSLSHNPTYSVTNATIAVKTGTLEGLSSNKPTFVNQTQTIILPQESVIMGRN